MNPRSAIVSETLRTVTERGQLYSVYTKAMRWSGWSCLLSRLCAWNAVNKHGWAEAGRCCELAVRRQAQQQRLKALGFSAQQVVAMGSMTEAQVAAEILKAVESAETRSTTTAAAAVSAPAATAAVATEEDPLDAAYAAMAATAAEVRARNSLTTVPFPGKLNGMFPRQFLAKISDEERKGFGITRGFTLGDGNVAEEF
jgi:hypothetical protein